MKKFITLLLVSSCAMVAFAQEKKTQSAKLTLDAQGYVLIPSTLMKGIPVKMEVDLNSVKGCSRAVVINSFGVKKTVMKGDAFIVFAPTKTGDIDIVCGMGMYHGVFKVVEAVEPKK